MSSERQRLHEERLQQEIEELRSDLGETVEALAYKADVPARAKERGTAVKEEAIERGLELRQQAVARGSELSERVMEWYNDAQARLAAGSSELVQQTVRTVEWARESLRQAPRERWVKLTGVVAAAGAGLLAMAVMVRRVRG
jgi:ElaB/YqjD/DUF883 family membrane-anchored ribosome-binding protein